MSKKCSMCMTFFLHFCNSITHHRLFRTEKLKLGHFTNPKPEYNAASQPAPATMLSKMQERVNNMKKMYVLKNDVPASAQAKPSAPNNEKSIKAKSLALSTTNTNTMPISAGFQPPPPPLPRSSTNNLLSAVSSDHLLQSVSILATSHPSLNKLGASKPSLSLQSQNNPLTSSNQALPTSTINTPSVARVKDPFWDDDDDNGGGGVPSTVHEGEDLVNWATSLPTN